MLSGAKKAFDTREEAEAFIAGDSTMNAYQCSRCGLWHNGHKRGYGYGSSAARAARKGENR